jgi:alkylmercury lyase-like protein
VIDGGDLALRNRTYALLVELGRPPQAGEVGPAEEVHAGWRRLHDVHALVLDGEGEILMANPFSAVETPHRVHAAGRWWYGNCAWDAFGICAALGVDGRIETECPDCAEGITVDIRGGRPGDESLLFHCLVPAAHWWDDIVFT